MTQEKMCFLEKGHLALWNNITLQAHFTPVRWHRQILVECRDCFYPNDIDGSSLLKVTMSNGPQIWSHECFRISRFIHLWNPIILSYSGYRLKWWFSMGLCQNIWPRDIWVYRGTIAVPSPVVIRWRFWSQLDELKLVSRCFKSSL